MADIELVIKMPKEMYAQIIDENGIDTMLIPYEDIIKNGTPLPKGHEKIINTDIIKDFKNKIKHYEKDYRFTQEEILNILKRYEIKYAPTIIETDKEDE